MPLQITKKLFAAIHAGNLIKDTELEGGDVSESFDFLVSYFESNNPDYQSMAKELALMGSSIKVMDQKLNAIRLQGVIPAGADDETRKVIIEKRNSNTLFDNLVGSVIEDVNKLTPGKRVVIPGGWASVGGNPGHAMLYVIELMHDGTYEFKIFNTGGGVEKNHASAMVTGAEIFEVGNHAFTIEGLKLSDLNSPSFKTAMSFALQQQVRPNWEQKETDPTQIYDEFKIALVAGNPQAKIKQTNYTDLHKFQKAGNCYYYVLKPLLRELLTTRYAEIQLDIKLQSLLAFYADNKPKLAEDLEAYHLIKFAVQKLANATNKRWQSDAESPVISKQKAQEILKECQRIESELSQIHQTKLTGKPYQIDLKSYRKPDNTKLLEDVRKATRYNPEQRYVIPYKVERQACPSINTTVAKTSDELINTLRENVVNCTNIETLPKTYLDMVTLQLRKYILELPSAVDPFGESFSNSVYAQLSSAQKNEFLELTNKLFNSFHYFAAKNDDLYVEEKLLPAAKLLSIMDMLTREKMALEQGVRCEQPIVDAQILQLPLRYVNKFYSAQEHETYQYCNLYFQTALGVAERPLVVRFMDQEKFKEHKQLAASVDAFVEKDNNLLSRLAYPEELDAQLPAYMKIQEERKAKDDKFQPYSEKEYKNILLLMGTGKNQKSIYPSYIDNLRSANLRFGMFVSNNMLDPFRKEQHYQKNLVLTLNEESENKGKPIGYNYQLGDTYPWAYQIEPAIRMLRSKEEVGKKLINRQLSDFEKSSWDEPHPDDVDFKKLFENWNKPQEEVVIEKTESEKSRVNRRIQILACRESKALRLGEVVHLYENEARGSYRHKYSFLEFLLFSPDSSLLHDAITKPLVVIHIAEYLKRTIELKLADIDPELLNKGYQKEAALESIKTFMTLFYNLSDFLDVIEKKHPDIKIPRLDEKEISKRIAPLGDIRDLQGQQLYKQPLNLESILEFLQFYFDLQIQANSDNSSRKEAQKAAAKSFANTFVAIEAFLKSNPESILSIAKLLAPDIKVTSDMQIEAKFPYYQLKLNGKLITEFNILTAECRTDQGFVVTMPRDFDSKEGWIVGHVFDSRSLMDDATVKGIFNDGFFHFKNYSTLGEVMTVVTKQVDLTKPGFIKKDWREYEFNPSNFFDCHLFKKMDGKWYRYLGDYIPGLRRIKSAHFIDQKSTIWVECDPQTGVNPNGSMYLFDQEAIRQQENRGADYTEIATQGLIAALNDNRIEQLLYPLSVNLSAIIKQGHDELDKIQLNVKDKNNSDLVINVEQNGQLTFQNYPGYFVVDIDDHTHLQGFKAKDFVLIENAQGEQKALMSTSLLHKKRKIYSDLLGVDEVRNKVIDIPIHHHTLKPSTVEQKSLLIYRFMLRREYKLAAKLVGDLLNNPDISVAEAQELREYFSSQGVTDDKSPDQLALSILLSRMQNGNVNLYSPIIATDNLQEIFAYEKYLEILLTQANALFARANNLSAEVSVLWRKHGRECLNWLLKEIELYKTFYEKLTELEKNQQYEFHGNCDKLMMYALKNMSNSLSVDQITQPMTSVKLFEKSENTYDAVESLDSDAEVLFRENAQLAEQENNFENFPIYNENHKLDLKSVLKHYQSMVKKVVENRDKHEFIQSFYLWLYTNKNNLKDCYKLFTLLFDLSKGHGEPYSSDKTIREFMNAHFRQYPHTSDRMIDLVANPGNSVENATHERPRVALLTADASSLPTSEIELNDHKASIQANQHHSQLNALQKLFEITEKPSIKVQAPFTDDEINQQESPIVKNSMTQFNQRYLQEAAKVKSSERISNEHLQQLIQELQKQKEGAGLLVNSLTEELVKLLNTPPDDEAKQLQIDLEIQAGKRKPLSLENALDLYLAHNQQLFEKLTFLNSAQQELFMHKMTDYLIHVTQAQQAERCLNKAKSIEQHFDTASASMMSELYHLLQKRHYDLDYHSLSARAKICLEVKSNILMRAKQALKVDAMCTKDVNTNEYPSVIVQMLMGDGKTKVVSATIARVKADGTSVPVIVVPNAIFELNKNDLLAQSSEVFGQRASTFRFNRTIISANEYLLLTKNQLSPQDPNFNYASTRDKIRQYKVERVQAISKQFDEMLANCGYFVLTPDTLHSIDLAHVDALRAGDEALENALYELKQRFKTQSDLIIDEVDTVLHVRKETHYTLNKPEKLRPDEGELILKIYNDYYSLPDNPQRLTVLLEKVANYQDFALNQQQRSEFIQAIKDLWEDAEKPTPLSFMDEVRNSDPERARLIALAKEQLSSLMPLVTSKKCMVDYGPSRVTKRPYAIPYLNNNNPNEVADFANIYEILNYTIRMFYEGNVDTNLIKRFIYAHKQLMRDEAETFDMPRSMTKAAEAYEALFKVSLISINPEDPKALEQFKTTLQQEFPRMAAFLSMMVLPEIKSYPYKISHFGTNLVDMFRTAQGLTGTPWNISTFNPKFKPDLDVGAEERVAIALIEKQNNSKVVCLNNIKPDKIIEQLDQDQSLANDLANLNALIDVGALFAGQDNQQVAQGFLTALMQFQQKFAHIKGVLFFDLATKSLKIMGQNGNSVKLNGSDYQYVLDAGFKPEDLFTYYDQSNTTGTDVRQQPNAIAYMTVDKSTLARDTFQGAFRMRKLLEEQHVKIAIPLNVYQHYQQVSKQDELTTKDVVKVNVMNEGHLLGEDNIRGLTQNINNVFKQACELLLRKVMNSKERIQLYSALLNWYESKEQTDAYELFGKVLNQGDPKVIFTAFINERIKTFKNDLQKDQVTQRFPSPILEDLLLHVTNQTTSILDDVVKAHLLPNKTTDFVSSSATGLVEVQQEVTQQQTTETQKQKQTEAQVQQQAETQVTAKSNYTEIPTQLFFENTNIYQDDLFKEVDAMTLNSHIAHTLGKDFEHLYNENIFVSTKLTKTVNELPEVLLTPFEKIPLHLFVIKDVDQEPKILLLDEGQSRDLQNRMIMQKGVSEEQRVILHYSMNGELIQFGNNEASKQAFKHPDAKINQLLVQCQHFVGDIHSACKKPFINEFKNLLLDEPINNKRNEFFEKRLLSDPKKLKLYFNIKRVVMDEASVESLNGNKQAFFADKSAKVQPNAPDSAPQEPRMK